MKKNSNDGILWDSMPVNNGIIEQEKMILLKYIELASAVILLLGKDGKIKLINEKGSGQMGYKQHDMAGKDWFDNYIPVRIRARVRAVYKRIISGKSRDYSYSEYAIIFKDGRERMFEWRNSIMKNPSGKIIGLLIYGTDVTEMRKNELDLIESEGRFRYLVENSPNVILIMDRHGSILDCNISAEKTTGYSKKELINRNKRFNGIVSAKERARFFGLLKFMHAKKLRKTTTPFELCLKKKNGTELNMEFGIVNIEFGGEEILLVTGTDITEKKKNLVILRELILCNGLRADIWEITSDASKGEQEMIDRFMKKIGTSLGLRRLAYFCREDDYFLCAGEWRKNSAVPGLGRMKFGSSIVDVIVKKIELPVKALAIDDLIKLATKHRLKAVQAILLPILKTFGCRPGFFIPLNFNGKLDGFLIYFSDEKDFWTENKTNLIIDASNIIIKSLNRNRLEKELKDNEEKYRLITENIADVVWTTDIKNHYTFISPSIEWVAGYNPEELVGKSMNFIRTAERFRYNTENIQSLRNANAPKTVYYETEIIKKDGSIIPAESIVSAIRNSGGEITGFSGVTRDISERKKIEQVMKNSEKYFKALTEESSDIIVVMSKDGVISYISPAVEKILGYRQNEFVGRIFKEVFLVGGQRNVFDGFIRKMDYSIGEMNLRGKSKAGHLVIFDVTVKNLLNDPAINGIVMNFRNISEIKKHEENMKRIIWQLEYANSELEQFVYVASHDLKEPLRVISNYLDLIKLKYKDEVNSEINEFISFAVDGARRMYDLIQALLEYSRTGKKHEDMEQVDLNVIAKMLAQEFSDRLEGGRIIINNLPVISARHTEMIQLFQNLIDNAIKFRSQTDLEIIISAEDGKTENIFSVRDNGIGIKTEYREKIFKLFERLHNDDKYKGTGIGLTICKKIVDGYGGRIWVESEEKKGTRVLFSLPKGR